MAVAEERDQRHRRVILLEGRVDLPLEQFAWASFERGAALVGPEFLGFPQPPVAVVELLHQPGQPAGAGLGHHHLELRVAFEDAPGEQIDKRFEKIVEKPLGVLEHAGGLARGAAASDRQEHRDVPGQDDAALFERRPQRLPGRVVELRVDVGDHQIDLPHPASGDQAPQFRQRAGRGFRQHRHADQPVRRGAAEFEQPVIVDAVASLAQGRVVGRDLEDRAEDDLGLDLVAVHVGEPQFGDRRPARALVEQAGAVEGVVDRLDRPRRGSSRRWRRRRAVPAAPHLAVADPHRLAVALLDMRRAVAQRGRQPRRPQIGRQLR